MFRPSAAPRWKITTRRFLPLGLPSAAYTARARKLGMAVVPTTAIAPCFRKTRRVRDMVDSLSAIGSRLSAFSSPVRAFNCTFYDEALGSQVPFGPGSGDDCRFWPRADSRQPTSSETPASPGSGPRLHLRSVRADDHRALPA